MRVKGFTLVEVLVAAVILIAALGLTSTAVKSLRIQAAQADKAISMVSPVRSIVAVIRQDIRESPQAQMQGKGQLLGVAYNWVARVEKQAAAPARISEDTGSLDESPARFFLYSVELTLEQGARQQSFQYKELAWAPLRY